MAPRKSTSVTKILEMSVHEQILAVEEIWDSIAARATSLPVSATQKKELDRRLKSIASEPEAGTSWEEVRRRIEKRPRK
ncbi:addiction module protein [Bdellovibrionota bacterium FG-2]